MTTIEKIAKEIYEGRNGHGCKPWGRLPDAHKEPYLGDARAALVAIREPSEGMRQAAIEKIGYEVDWVSGLFGGAYGAAEEVYADSFTAMIDAVLGEEGAR